MTTYPDTLPGPTIAGYGATVAMGVIRSDMDTHQQQRRVFTSMPHTLTLRFVLTITEWAQWHAWVIDNGYRWFEINLATLYAGQVDQTTVPVLIRLTSSFAASELSANTVQVSVAAEMAPSMIGDYLEGIA